MISINSILTIQSDVTEWLPRWPKNVNQRTDSPESRLVYTRLEVALQILERKIYKNVKISSLYS